MKLNTKRNITKARLTPFTAVLLAILILYVAVLFTFLIWGFVSSLANYVDYKAIKLNTDSLWPKVFRIKNYVDIFEKFSIDIHYGEESVNVIGMYGNSLLYALGSCVIKTAVVAITAYACARFTFKFSKVVYSIVIITMILPVVGSLPAEIQMAQFFRLYDSIPGMWVMKANFLGMYFLVFYAFFSSLPKAYTEAAKIDGASNFRIMFRVHLPLAGNLLTSVALIDFVNYWNDYTTPLSFLDNHPTVALGLLKIINGTNLELTAVSMKMAATFMVAIPILIVFIIFQKRLMGNLTVGGIKG